MTQDLSWTPSERDIQAEKSRIAKEVEAIGIDTLTKLASAAFEAKDRTYSPYSHFPVGSAVLDTAGLIHTGQNIEVATYSEAGHAEEQAIKNAVSSGVIATQGRMFVRAIAATAAPCGRCRQIIAEFSDNPLIVILDTKGNIQTITSLMILLPLAFSPKDLPGQ
jgi:cytidine deaminase